MQFYWSIDRIPELAGLSLEQKKQAWQFCYKKYAFKHWQSWVSLFGIGIFVVVGTKLLNVGAFIGGAIGGGIGGGIFGVTMTNVLRPHLRDYANSHFGTASSSTEPSPDR